MSKGLIKTKFTQMYCAINTNDKPMLATLAFSALQAKENYIDEYFLQHKRPPEDDHIVKIACVNIEIEIKNTTKSIL